MLLYNLIVLVLLLPLLAVAFWNGWAFARIVPGRRPLRAPALSVLVPARNEERSIAECVRSLLAQSYRPLEVLVLDDGSTDTTGEILAQLEREHPELRVLHGTPPPEGWLGKNWACAQLAAQATGEWLLFTDADTAHEPDGLLSALAWAEGADVEFFSGVPQLELGSFLERAVVPMAPFLYFTTLPNPLIARTRAPSLSAANGQYLWCQRRVYAAIGGHGAVRGEIVEDVQLARLAKRRGYRVGLAGAASVVRCRMYRSSREVIDGFSKNLFPGLGYSVPGTLLFAAAMLALFVLPLLFVAVALVRGKTGPSLSLPLVHLGIGALLRALLARTLRLGPGQIVMQPFGAFGAAFIALRSMRLFLQSRGPQWKGRALARRT